MITKEKVKRKIDRVPEKLLNKVDKYIDTVISEITEKKKIHTFKLKGQFDDIDIRESAYE
ncbi:MAG: hypothetical protein IPH62_19220 [Ignavibacteriae bacterium]|nr:hypothetical protein [Ignavibacteriota bacterium]